MAHEYLYPVYSATNKIARMSQSRVVVPSQEYCPTMDHTHVTTKSPPGLTNITSSRKTEVAQVIKGVMPSDRSIQVPY